MPERVERHTIYTWMDWWLVEGFFLFWIVDMTFELCLVSMAGTSIYRIFRSVPWQSHALSFIAVAFLIWFIVVVSEANEKRAFVVVLMTIIFRYIAGFTHIDRLMVFLDIAGFVMAIVAYYYVRKAGQYRRLNCIRSPFGKKGKTTLALSVALFASIAVVLGIGIYLILPVSRLIR